jgi:hypothetical protein
MVPVGAGAGLLFFLFFGFVFLTAIGGLVIGVAAIINVATTPAERFGPWWDNTKQMWLIGIAVGYVIPLGTIIAGIAWFTGGRRGLSTYGVAGRPFWAGPPKPAPIAGPPGYGPPPPSTWRPS